MSDIRKIRVMISSRSLTTVFGGTLLSDVRIRLQTFLQSIRWCAEDPGRKKSAAAQPIGRDQSLFDVWIHENAVKPTADRSTLDISLEEISKADVVIVLYTGEPGSADAQDIGICHAELQQAHARRAEIVSMIDLVPLQSASTPRHKAFRDFVDSLSLYRKEARNETELRQHVVDLLQQQISDLVLRGATIGTRKRDRGQAMDWNLLDIAGRQAAMRKAIAACLPVEETSDAALGIMNLPGGDRIAVRIDAIPAALSVSAARERVGQPFLQDHQYVPILQAHGVPGVVHVIACHRGVSEAQATRMLGTPDAISVSSDFGVFVADHVQKIQIIFLAQCADKTATALAVRRFREWIRLPGEEKRLVERATWRRRILETIASDPSAVGKAPGLSSRKQARRRSTL